MAEISVQLIMTVGICSLVGITLFVLICKEARQRKHARGTALLQSAPEIRLSVGDRSTPEARMASPGHNKQTGGVNYFTGANRCQGECEELRHIGFTRTQIDRLITYRAAYRAGHYQLDVLLPGRLQFTRWLYQQGKING